MDAGSDADETISINDSPSFTTKVQKFAEMLSEFRYLRSRFKPMGKFYKIVLVVDQINSRIILMHMNSG